MKTEVAKTEDTKSKALIAAVEQAITAGNLAALNPEQKLYYYNQVCTSVGLNPLTRPLDFIQLNGKLVLYAKKDATDQLRKIYKVSITKLDEQVKDGMCIVTAYARDKDGKEDSDVGAVPLPQGGEARANAIMKCVTKAKRRVTLSICGMGLLDETELETIPGAKGENFDASVSTQAKSDNRTKALSDKLAPAAQVTEAGPAAIPEAINAADKPPAKPAAAPAKAKDPEVLPKAEKPTRKAAAKPEPVKAVEEKPIPESEADLGAVQVPFGDNRGKPLSELEDRQLVELKSFYTRNGEPNTPHFKWFKRVFDAYTALFDLSAYDTQEPETVPPTPTGEEDPGAFFEQPTELPSFEEAAIAKIEAAKTGDELVAAWKSLLDDCKDPKKINLKGMDPAAAKEFNLKAIKAKDKRKAELGVKTAPAAK